MSRGEWSTKARPRELCVEGLAEMCLGVKGATDGLGLVLLRTSEEPRLIMFPAKFMLPPPFFWLVPEHRPGGGEVGE